MIHVLPALKGRHSFHLIYYIYNIYIFAARIVHEKYNDFLHLRQFYIQVTMFEKGLFKKLGAVLVFVNICLLEYI